MTTSTNAANDAKAALEEGAALTPRYDANGLITAVVTDARDNEVLMLAHMNAQALKLTLDTGIAHYWSRSRNSLWKKGETSGNLQTVDEIRIDCDQDAVVIKVRVSGADATCHTGRKSCFYRKIVTGNSGSPRLEADSEPLFDPATVYTDH
tara:strand:+ start:14746 stop:15198 length:453 start_codon:yes stop_codon:yes gene_type:complete